MAADCARCGKCAKSRLKKASPYLWTLYLVTGKVKVKRNLGLFLKCSNKTKCAEWNKGRDEPCEQTRPGLDRAPGNLPPAWGAMGPQLGPTGCPRAHSAYIPSLGSGSTPLAWVLTLPGQHTPPLSVRAAHPHPLPVAGNRGSKGTWIFSKSLCCWFYQANVSAHTLI